MLFKYIAYHYLRYFFIILSGLVLFLVGFDYMDNADKLSQSANLILIYIAYMVFYAIDILLPLSLIFAMISVKVFLMKSNALISFYSIGYKRIDVLRPFLIVSSIVIAIYISLHTLPDFVKSQEFANNIKSNSQYLSPTKNLFFTYKGRYVYFEKMSPLIKTATGVRVFSFDKSALKTTLVAKKAIYIDDCWKIEDAYIIKKPIIIDYENGIEVKENYYDDILCDFRPKMLDQVYEGKVNFTIGNAIDAILFLHKQNVNIDSIKIALYKIFIYPLFVPSMVVIIFFFVPISVRFANTALLSFVAILSTLMIWGILFMLLELSINKTIMGEIGIILPIVILAGIAFRQWRVYK